MAIKAKITPLALITAIFLSHPALGGSQPVLDKTGLEPVAVVSEYTGTPEHSNATPVVYKSINAGIGWERNEIKSSQGRIRSISCNGKNCVGAGEAYSGSTTTLMTYNSFDGGYNWFSHNLGLFGGASGLEAVTCDAKQHCIAVGAATPVRKGGMQPIVFTSDNGGNSWTPNYPEPLGVWPTSSALRAISCSGEASLNCVAVGEFYPDGKTTTFISYFSNDGGLHWSHQTIASYNNVESILTSLSCSNGSKYCVVTGHASLDQVGQPASHHTQAVMYETYNSGKDWSRINLPFNNSVNTSLSRINCSQNRCTAVGSENGRPVILMKRDGGNWEKSNPNFYSVSANKITGLDVDLRYNFSVKNSNLESVICDDASINCAAIGYTRYIVTLKPYKRIYVVLPTIYYSSDSGSTWSHSWPAFADKSCQMHGIESVAIDIANTEK